MKVNVLVLFFLSLFGGAASGIDLREANAVGALDLGTGKARVERAESGTIHLHLSIPKKSPGAAAGFWSNGFPRP